MTGVIVTKINSAAATLSPTMLISTRESFTREHSRARDRNEAPRTCAAPWLTILIVGHIIVPIVLTCEENIRVTMGLAFTIYLPLIVGLTLILLPRCKGVIAALLWAMKAEGSEKT
jgi:uncharacterized protein (DUF983 family)